MSSNENQFAKKIRRQVKLNPQTDGGLQISSTAKIRTIGSARTGGNQNFTVNQTSSSFVSGREMNRDAMASAMDRIHFPGRAGLGNSGVNQTSTQSSKVRRFEAGSMNIGSGSGMGTSGSRGGSREEEQEIQDINQYNNKLQFKQGSKLDQDQENIKAPKNPEPLVEDLEQDQIMELITQEEVQEMDQPEKEEQENHQDIKVYNNKV